MTEERDGPSEQDLYAMGQESPTAYVWMPEICKALDKPYPPKQSPEGESK